MKKMFLLAALCLSINAASANHADQFLNRYAPLAMQLSQKSGIPVSIILAQAIMESSWGNSNLAQEANNFFGIKCKSTWNGDSFYKKDDDFKNQKLISSCFRSYNTPSESFNDYTNFIISRNRYKHLFELQPTDYKGWAIGLQKAGYATNPNYANKLIQLIEKYELFKYNESFLRPVAYTNHPINNTIITNQSIPKAVRLPKNYFPGYFDK